MYLAVCCLLSKSLHIKQIVLLLDLTAWLKARSCRHLHYKCFTKSFVCIFRCNKTMIPKNVVFLDTIFQEINLFCFFTTLKLTHRIIRKKMKYYTRVAKVSSSIYNSSSFLQKSENNVNISS